MSNTNTAQAPDPSGEPKRFWQVRHGDLTVCRVRALPAHAEPVTQEDAGILARGEVTGHAHRIAESEVKKSLAALWFEVKAEAGDRLSHEEHKTIQFPPGFAYRSVPKRQYTPDGWETVRD